jgi:hypothetical protein
MSYISWICNQEEAEGEKIDIKIINSKEKKAILIHEHYRIGTPLLWWRRVTNVKRILSSLENVNSLPI